MICKKIYKKSQNILKINIIIVNKYILQNIFYYDKIILYLFFNKFYV